MKFKDSRAVIIGGSSGIGLATAKAFAEAGASVVITGRSLAKLREAQQSIKESQVVTDVLDGKDGPAVQKFFEEIGPIDHLVIAAGGGGVIGPLHTIDEGDFRAAFDRKFWIHFLAARHGAGALRQGGSLTFVTAVTPQKPTPMMAGLAAVNGAINAMVGPLALELAPTRVNAVAPGLIDTPYWANMPAERREAFLRENAAQLPVQRTGTAEDVADAILFLAGNGFTTGLVLPLDGGYHMANTVTHAESAQSASGEHS
jgi:NAD(P)-dependent dehydrogenase (short-subunit alcohol dehydrogenase family)